ncbi:MAG: hypothetical protein CMH33_06200 [Microbacterium sp.]|nr:hypothetical protein [Microbacterium sp.]
MPADEADARARQVVGSAREGGSTSLVVAADLDGDDVIGGAWRAAGSSFLFFASGAIIPVLPWLFGLTGLAAVFLALALVGVALLATGALVGILSGAPPVRRALRQLAIGWGAAAVTYVLGLLFGVGVA